MSDGMREVFLTILRMSFVAGYVILVVLFVRRLLRRFPKRYSYLLWSVVFSGWFVRSEQTALSA